MNKTTTVAHMIAEKLEKLGKEIKIPEDIKGDLIKEHNWMFFEREGPLLMTNQRELFHQSCDEIDKGISSGTITFNSDDGTITFQ